MLLVWGSSEEVRSRPMWVGEAHETMRIGRFSLVWRVRGISL